MDTLSYSHHQFSWFPDFPIPARSEPGGCTDGFLCSDHPKKTTHTMRTVLHYLRRVPEAPLAHIQPLCFPAAYEVLRVEGRVPGFDVEVAEEEVRDAALH